MKKYTIELMNGTCGSLGEYDDLDAAYADLERMIAEDRSEGFTDGEEHPIYAIKDASKDEIMYSVKA